MKNTWLQKEVSSEEDREELIESLTEADTNTKVPSGYGYSDLDRKRAVYTFMVLGSIKDTCSMLNIPRRVLFNWRQTEWWKQLTDEAKDLHAEQLDVSFTRVLDNVLGEIEDRLSHGDEVLGPKGKKDTKKVSARDLATILGIMFDKRQINRNAPTSISRSGSEKDLERLANNFKELARGALQRPGDDARIIDGETVEDEEK